MHVSTSYQSLAAEIVKQLHVGSLQCTVGNTFICYIELFFKRNYNNVIAHGFVIKYSSISCFKVTQHVRSHTHASKTHTNVTLLLDHF
jgi:hypothetical protein